MKYFRMSYEEVVFNRSYITIMLLNRSIPSYKFDSNESGYEKGKKNNPNRKSKEYHKIDRAMHANDFFMDMM